jgi:hypothetical protein
MNENRFGKFKPSLDKGGPDIKDRLLKFMKANSDIYGKGEEQKLQKEIDIQFEILGEKEDQVVSKTISREMKSLDLPAKRTFN